MITCATPISGWPETKYSTAAQAPSTRKIGMPADSRPKNITRNSTVATGQCSRRRGQVGRQLGVRDVVPDRHRRRIEMEQVAVQADQVAHRHQRAAGRQGGVVDPHRELQGAGCWSRPASSDVSTICQPYQTMPTENTRATRQLNASSQRWPAGGTRRSTRSGRTWPSVRTNWLEMIITAQTIR